MTIEELKKYKWFVATCKYEGIVGKKHCFTYDVDNLNTNLLSGMILVDDELPEYDEWVNLLLYRYLEQHYYEKKWMTYIQVDRKMNDEMRLS